MPGFFRHLQHRSDPRPGDCCRRFKIRLAYANAVYWRDMWNWLDWVNFTFFIIVFFIRVICDSMVNERLESISELSNIEDPWADEDLHLPMYRLGFLYRAAMWLNAVNAMLTWLKVFKFLNYFPNLQILTATLGHAAWPLAWFMLVLLIVLTGLSQGFHIAFGFDISGYQTLLRSILSLLRMCVGDFDYQALEDSHYIIGPLMFWVFIVLVFFILMSVFIALIAQAYEDAREDLDNYKNNSIARTPAVSDPSRVAKDTLLAKNKLRAMSARKMVSEPLAFSLRQPLAEVEQAMRPHGTLLDLSAPTTLTEKVGNKMNKDLRDLEKMRKSTRAMMTAAKAVEMMSPRTKMNGMEKTSATAALARKRAAQTKADLIAEQGITLSHPIDTFTDDDDDPTYDELKDLFGNSKTAHLFDRAESRCRVTVYGVRDIHDVGHDNVRSKTEGEALEILKRADVYLLVTLCSDRKQPHVRRTADLTLDNHGSGKWNFGEGEPVGFDMLCEPGTLPVVPATATFSRDGSLNQHGDESTTLGQSPTGPFSDTSFREQMRKKNARQVENQPVVSTPT